MSEVAMFARHETCRIEIYEVAGERYIQIQIGELDLTFFSPGDVDRFLTGLTEARKDAWPESPII